MFNEKNIHHIDKLERVEFIAKKQYIHLSEHCLYSKISNKDRKELSNDIDNMLKLLIEVKKVLC